MLAASPQRNYWCGLDDATENCVTIKWGKFFLRLDPEHVLKMRPDTEKVLVSGEVINHAFSVKMEELKLKRSKEEEAETSRKVWEIIKSRDVQAQIQSYIRRQNDLKAEKEVQATKKLIKYTLTPSPAKTRPQDAVGRLRKMRAIIQGSAKEDPPQIPKPSIPAERLEALKAKALRMLENSRIGK